MYERGWETNKREQTNSTAAAAVLAVLAVLAVFVGLLVGWRRGKHGPVVFCPENERFFFLQILGGCRTASLDRLLQQYVGLCGLIDFISFPFFQLVLATTVLTDHTHTVRYCLPKRAVSI